MLFPLGQELQCEDISQRVEVSDTNLETQNTEEDSGQMDPEIEEKQGYQGKSHGKSFRTS